MNHHDLGLNFPALGPVYTMRHRSIDADAQCKWALTQTVNVNLIMLFSSLE